MKIRSSARILVTLTMPFMLFACGGGGGGGGGSSTPTSLTINGVAQAGVFSKGKAVFIGYDALNTPYAITFSNFSGTQGAFSANVGSYNGPLRINVSGTYTDEATGKTVTIPEASPLKALIPSTSVTNGVSVPVTPLTDIAATKTLLSGINNTTINQNNQGIAQLFGLTDVTKTTPVSPTTITSQTAGSSAVTYAVALVQLSQYVAQYAANTNGLTSDALQSALPSALAQIGNGINVTTGAATNSIPVVTITAPEVENTLSTIINTSSAIPNMGNGIPAATLTTIQTAFTASSSMSSSVNKYDLNVTTSSSIPIYGVQLSIIIPTGMLITSDANGVISTGSVTSAVTGGIVVGTLKSNTLNLSFETGSGFIPSTVAAVKLATILSSVSGTAASSLTVSNATAFDKNGNQLPGVSVSVSMSGR